MFLTALLTVSFYAVTGNAMGAWRLWLVFTTFDMLAAMRAATPAREPFTLGPEE